MRNASSDNGAVIRKNNFYLFGFHLIDFRLHGLSIISPYYLLKRRRGQKVDKKIKILARPMPHLTGPRQLKASMQPLQLGIWLKYAWEIS
jgi:hypothetical protein